MRSQTKIFSHLVRDYMRGSPVVVTRGATVRDLLGHMGAAKATSALIVDQAGRLAGIITEQDVTRRITSLLLREQLADFKAGEEVGNYVHPDRLSEREKDILVDSFKTIDALRDRVHAEFTGEVF